MKELIDIFLGEREKPVGVLSFESTRAAASQFAYSTDWLDDVKSFAISPDLPLVSGWHFVHHHGPSPFPFAVSDTEPDRWGRQVIDRSYRKANQIKHELSPLDYLLAVDDFSRIGALRFSRKGEVFKREEDGRRRTPTQVDLSRCLAASRRVELDRQTEEDLAFLEGKATSLGGARPKCTFLDVDGSLAIGKFPSANDEHDIAKGEALALALSHLAGIDTAKGRVVSIDGNSVCIIKRFDRIATTRGLRRLHYWSMQTLLQKETEESASWAELFDALYLLGLTDLQQLAREILKRIFLNYLINNVDDHFRNTGVLMQANRTWCLAPAFDLNPVPLKSDSAPYISKTQLAPHIGFIEDIREVFDHLEVFAVDSDLARQCLSEVLRAVDQWEAVAKRAVVGMSTNDIRQYRPAFSLKRREVARSLL